MKRLCCVMVSAILPISTLAEEREKKLEPLKKAIQEEIARPDRNLSDGSQANKLNSAQRRLNEVRMAADDFGRARDALQNASNSSIANIEIPRSEILDRIEKFSKVDKLMRESRKSSPAPNRFRMCPAHFPGSPNSISVQ